MPLAPRLSSLTPDPRPPTSQAGDAVDEGTKKRGRRMFAGLVGVLKQFSRDEKKHSAVTAKRRTIVEQARGPYTLSLSLLAP